MSRNGEPSEIRSEYVTAMGAPLGRLHYELSGELVQLHAIWGQYRVLYVDKEESVVLLNQTAPRFFHYAQRLLENEILLHLCRLTDPPSMGSHQNLAVTRLPELVEAGALRCAVQEEVDKAVEATAFARDHRNRRIAHRDLPVARNVQSRKLEDATLQKIRLALDAIAGCLGVVGSYYLGSSSMFGVAPEGPGGAKSLLHYLERGRKHLLEEHKKYGLE